MSIRTRLGIVAVVAAIVFACSDRKDHWAHPDYADNGDAESHDMRFCDGLQRQTPLTATQDGEMDRVSIVNGTTTSGFRPVVRIRKWGSSCTGTALNDSTLVTAKHCVGYGEGGGVSYNNVYALKSVTSSDVDLAVLVFPARTFRSETISVIERSPRPNDTLLLVGYGQTDYVNDNTPDGKKRVGCNTLVGFADRSGYTLKHRTDKGDYIHYRSPVSAASLRPGEQAMTGRGDSGGPIFINGQLAAVVSFGTIRSQMGRTWTLENEPPYTGDLLYEYDVNLHSDAAVALFRKAVSEIGAVIPGLDKLEKSVTTPTAMSIAPPWPEAR